MEDVKPGLEGVVAFETAIAEPDRAGGALRYRGVDIEELVGVVPFEEVWALLVDGSPGAALAPAGPGPVFTPTGDPRVDLQAALVTLAPAWGARPLLDLPDGAVRHDLARASATALDVAARSARGGAPAPVAGTALDGAPTLAERFLLSWRGEADPVHARALDGYWVTAAEHGMNASTFTARIVASTGADVPTCLSAAVGALSGPLHGGAPARVLTMLDRVEAEGDASRWVRRALDRGERLMGFGHRVYRAEDPRARVLRRMAAALGSPRYEVAEALESAAVSELAARWPDRPLRTNVEFWSAVVLDHAGIPARLFTTMFACARMAGWSAHILEQKRAGRLVRPTARYVGAPPHALVTTG